MCADCLVCQPLKHPTQQQQQPQKREFIQFHAKRERENILSQLVFIVSLKIGANCCISTTGQSYSYIPYSAKFSRGLTFVDFVG